MTATNLSTARIRIAPMILPVLSVRGLVILLIGRGPAKEAVCLLVPTAAMVREGGVRRVVSAWVQAVAHLNGYAMTLFACQKESSVAMREPVGTAQQSILSVAQMVNAALQINLYAAQMAAAQKINLNAAQLAAASKAMNVAAHTAVPLAKSAKVDNVFLINTE